MPDDSIDSLDEAPGRGDGPGSDDFPGSGEEPGSGGSGSDEGSLSGDALGSGGSGSDDAPGIDWDPDDGPFGPFRNYLERVGLWLVGVIVVGILLAVGSGETILSLDTTDYAITFVLLPYAAVLAVMWIVDAVSVWRDR